jgi:L-alanine-DL-glutamate epimerase-like enolase superfamily enzyme
MLKILYVLFEQQLERSCDILFGSHGQMTPASAIRLAKRIEKFDPMWLEEPTPPGKYYCYGVYRKKN